MQKDDHQSEIVTLKPFDKQTVDMEAVKMPVDPKIALSTTIKLSVGGTRFETTLVTLCKFPTSLFSIMFAKHSSLLLDADDYYFIDRDGTHFRYILNFLRSPETFELLLSGPFLKELKTECDYYRLTEYMFPSVVVAPFNIGTQHVQQNGFGIFSINNKPARVCLYCDCADSGSYEFLPSFKTIVKSKGGIIDAAQPHTQTGGSVCRFCSR